MKKAMLAIWRILISLKFAVIIMTGLTLALITATVLESKFDTPTAQYWVYRTPWFFLLLGALAVNILFVALSRLPWQQKHIPFLLAHFGILLLLWGSWLTYKYGLDGQILVKEGDTERAVEMQDAVLQMVAEDNRIHTVSVPWIPPHVSFRPIEIPELGLRISQYITHADPKIEFLPAENPAEGKAAIHVKIQGGPKAPPFMRMGQDFWLWLGDPAWSQSQAGGAQVAFRQDGEPELPQAGAALGVSWIPSKQLLRVSVKGSGGPQVRKFSIPLGDAKGKEIDTGWKFEAKATILDFIPSARSEVSYSEAQVQYGMQAASPAIRLEAADARGRTASIWLGMGERASLESGGKRVALGYGPHRVILPFGIRLQEFQIAHYEGTANPMEFSSKVTVIDDHPRPDQPVPVDHVISMNEPMKYSGFTFYQSSYVPGEPRPTVSIFSVNQDPGRWVKHTGSILICLGSILLFAMKNRRRKKVTP